MLDDWGLLRAARDTGVSLGDLLPKAVMPDRFYFYRPVGALLTWQIGWQLWGLNPLPYHLESLLLHACVALMLGLWLASASGRQSLGWLAGALFAVFPLHLEAVTWLAAQWDTLAAFFALLSLLTFTLWWRKREHNTPLYLAALLSYTLALLTKESIFSFPAILALGTYFATPRFNRAAIKKLTLALAPFSLVLAALLGVRLLLWGNIGGYPQAPTDVTTFAWDHLINFAQALLSPINPAVLGTVAWQIVGVTAIVLLLVGLILYGKPQLRLLALAVGWMLIAVAPVFNLRISPIDMHNNRYAYLIAAGYCIGLAALISAAVRAAGRLKPVALALTALLLLACIAVTWIQLRTWHAATVQSTEFEQSLLRSLPPQQPSDQNTTWFAQNLPNTYLGAYAEGPFLGYTRNFTYSSAPRIIETKDAAKALLGATNPTQSVFALQFNPVDKNRGFTLAYIAGVTPGSEPPAGAQAATNLQVWDFRQCNNTAIQTWTAPQNDVKCEQGAGLLLGSNNKAPQLTASTLDYETKPAGAQYIRLRVAVKYLQGPAPANTLSWYWATPGHGFDNEHKQTLSATISNQYRVYWTFIPIPTSQAAEKLTALRLDPTGTHAQTQIAWLAIDTLP